MTTRYATKTLQFDVSITWDATEECDESGSDIVDANVINVTVDDREYDNITDALDFMTKAHDKFGDWDYE